MHPRAPSPRSSLPSSQAAPSPVCIVAVKGENTSVDVKRLPKKKAPARFGRKLTATQKDRATHICLDWWAGVGVWFGWVGACFSCKLAAAQKREPGISAWTGGLGLGWRAGGREAEQSVEGGLGQRALG